MYSSSSAWIPTAEDREFDFDESRTGALRCLALALAGIGWLVGLGSIFFPPYQPNRVVELVICIWLMFMGWAVWQLRRFGLWLAAHCLAGGLVAALALGLVTHPSASALGLFAVATVAAATVGGPRHGFVWAAISTFTVLRIVAPATPDAGVEPLTVALVLIWASAAFAWLGFRPAYSAAEWAWSSYQDTLHLSQELRTRQGELGLLSKSLNEACDRLERQKVVLERARTTAEEARRQKAQFAAAISHELRTPINLIVGLSEMLMESLGNGAQSYSPASHREDLQVVYRNACHISHLVDDILDLSQVDAHRMGLQKELVQVREVVDSAVAALETQFNRKGLYLKVEMPGDMPRVEADATRLRQVLINLLSNATRFTDVGGATISGHYDEHEVALEVADTGVGIPSEELPHVFEEFHQVDQPGRRRKGSGLGLAVSRRLVELHDGRLWVESTAGQGSTFHISLPRPGALAQAPVGSQPRFFEPLGIHRAPTVVVLDGNQQAASVIQRYLDDYDVVPASSADQAWQLARDGRMDALLVTSEARVGRLQPPRDLTRDIPVVYCTLKTTPPLAQQKGVLGYLVKPVAKEQVQAALRKVHRPIRSVLVAEDDPDMRHLLARMAQGNSRRRAVCEAANGREALERVRENRPDLVLLDLLMPEMDGKDFLEAIRADPRLHDLPVIIISGRGYEESETLMAREVSFTREPALSVGELTRSLCAGLNVLLNRMPSPAAHLEDTVQEQLATPTA